MIRQARIGVIGAGHYATRSHIPALKRRRDVILQSVCRRGDAELEEVRSTFGFVHASTDWREVLDQPLDAAIISSPHHLHHEQAAAAIDRGLHVLVEKPMCLEAADAWDLVRRADARGVQLIVANGWHYRPGLASALDLVRGVGDIEFMTCHMASATRSVFEGSGGKRQFADGPFQPRKETWQDAARGGGFAWGQLSHLLALVLWITGARTRRARAMGLSGTTGVDLHDAAILEFHGGAMASVSGSCGLPEPHKSELDLRVYGSRGAFSLDLDRERMLLRCDDGRATLVENEVERWAYDCIGPVDALVDSVFGRGHNLSPGIVGARTVETLEALTASMRRDGAPIVVPEA